MADFHFLRPIWLLALVPLAFLYWRILFIRKHQSGWHQWLPKHLSQVLVNSGGKVTFWSAHRLGLFWLVATLALSGPTWERLPQPVYQLDSGQVVVLDMSPSLLAEDVNPNRLTRLRFKAMDLVRSGLDGDTGLIAYAADAFTISPLTEDNNNLLTLIPSLSPEIMPASGNNPLRALKHANQLLTNAGYSRGDIYWLTDGVDTQDMADVSNYLRATEHRVSILGVGTADGAPIRGADGALAKDKYGQVIVAKLYPDRLRDLAGLTGGVYTTSTSTNQDIERLTGLEPLSRKGKDGDSQQQGDQWQDVGPILALLLIPMVLFSWRKGGTLGGYLVGALLLVSAMAPHTAYAQTQSESPGWWLNNEQQAQQLMDAGMWREAAKLTQQPMRKGAAFYRLGDYAAAAEQFAQLDTAPGWYNRGNSLARQEDYQAALDAYEQALLKRPDWEDAKANRQLMQQLLEQQKQQQGQKEGDKNQKPQEKDDSQDGQGQNQSGQQQGEQPGDQQGQQQGQSSQSQQDKQQQAQEKQQTEQQQRDQAEQAQQEAQRQKQDDPAREQRSQQTEFSDDIDPERARQLEQWMNRVPDDPSLLLRRKMYLESQRRQQQGVRDPEGVEQKW
ncbi:Ca-activated chloride channel family protein [Idiomarina fontislapidosi]|uniref:VWFA domain-containing protein n=1 Tax=Idiomarina fontislapidosi TaxID=263723 RepID=A0A432YB49_9GAMM|nr:VWA domain-containing protein [Idiomarina fontislapidosi]PYE35295.1 Ca-activated chloride channel family protein [Idiomarina fontislapidosi]RUO58184.1 hypothetical protein CWE25_00890 [Idiomarina fontislapidosi]